MATAWKSKSIGVPRLSSRCGLCGGLTCGSRRVPRLLKAASLDDMLHGSKPESDKLRGRHFIFVFVCLVARRLSCL